MRSIDDFVQKVKGVARPTLYTISIATPPSVGNTDLVTSLAEAIVMPGRQISTLQKRFHGPMRDVPYDRLYSGDMDVTFLWPRDDSSVRTVFEEWMDEMVGGGGSGATRLPEERSDYTSEMTVSLDTGGWIMTLTEVWPKTINPVNLGWNMNDEYVRQVITFSFFEYTYGDSSSSNGNGSNQRQFRTRTY